ncbi:MAG: MmcQ/YjbR family DNA-binding protein [Solirubrobacterales bacterium]|nr:MmcQ/YjbR family DNA-binding protein [Solirubrobacterales bacterium]
MAALTDVERIALSLPQAEEGTWFGNRAWKVGGKTFVWDRPLGNKDEAELGGAVPEGPVVGVRVEDRLTKEVLCENEGPAVFTISHFRNFDAVLIDLEKVEEDLLEDLIAESWRVVAPPAVASD